MRDKIIIKIQYGTALFALILLALLPVTVGAADFDASLEEKKIVFTTDFSSTDLLDLTIGGGTATGDSRSSDGISLNTFGVRLNLASNCENCGGMSGEITGAIVETKMHSKAYNIDIEAILNSGKFFGNYVVGNSSFLSVIDNPVTIEKYSEMINSSDGEGAFSSTVIEKYYENRSDEVWTFVMNGGYAGFFTSMTEKGTGETFLGERD